MSILLVMNFCLTKSTLVKKIVIDFMQLIFLKNIVCFVLDNLFTSKITIDNVNADQITFIIDLMHGYDKNDLFSEKRRISVKKG